MVANLTAKGRKLVTIADPHIKRDEEYKIYKQMTELGFFIKDRDDREYVGDGWSGMRCCVITELSTNQSSLHCIWNLFPNTGSSAYPDFTRAEVRDFWASKFALNDYEGTSTVEN